MSLAPILCTFTLPPDKVDQEMLTEPEETIDDTVVGLYRLTELILSLLQDGPYSKKGKKQVATLAKMYARISDSLELLSSYEKANENGDEDLAHEFGISYSEAIADVQDYLDALQEDGIIVMMQ